MEAWIVAGLWGLIAGVLCGLVPFFLAVRRSLKRWAIAALFTCSACGVVLGLILALPVAISFTLAIAIASSSPYPKLQLPDVENPDAANSAVGEESS